MEQSNSIQVTSPQFEVIKSMEGFVKENLSSLLKPVEESWQPSDFLPDLTKEDWREQLVALRERAKELPDDILVVLVGDMITEEALPAVRSFRSLPESCRATQVLGYI